jgi:hypothetical protein
MPLNKDILGLDLYDKANAFNEVDIVDIEAARIAFWKTIAEGVIEHFKANISITIPAAGLLAPGGSGGPVTGSANTGTIL